MKKKSGFVLLILLIMCIGMAASCGKAKKSSEFTPNKDSEAYKTALDALVTADKYLDLVIDLDAKSADPAYKSKIEETKSLGYELLDTYAERIEIERDMLSQFYLIDKEIENDARIPAYTDVLQANVAVVAFDARTSLSDPDLVKYLDSDLLKSRNDLADALGAEARK